MAKVIELVRGVRCSIAGEDHRALLLEELSHVARLWKQTGSLGAYQVIVSALDSNADEIRTFAEKLLHRHSPRPCNCGGKQKEVRHA